MNVFHRTERRLKGAAQPVLAAVEEPTPTTYLDILTERSTDTGISATKLLLT